MPRWVVNLALFLVCAAVIFRFVVRVRSEIRRSPDLEERLSPLLALGIVMILSLLANALGLVSWVEIMAWSREQPPEMLHVLRDQAALVIGTAGLVALIPFSLLRPEVYTHPDPRLGALRGIVHMLESLILRFFLALIGFGLVFGVLGRSAIVALLAGELFLVWVVARIYLFFAERRQDGA